MGYLVAVPLASISDRYAARLTKKNNFLREAEMRLYVLIPAAGIAPAGLCLYGLTAERNLHWILYFIGVALCTLGAWFFFCITINYAIDSLDAQEHHCPQALIAMNLGKQAISFGISFYLLNWVAIYGYIRVISIYFVIVLCLNNVVVFFFLAAGKRVRAETARLTGRLHSAS